MKRLIFSLVTIGLLSTSVYAKTIMANENEVICDNKADLTQFFNEIQLAKGFVDTAIVFSRTGCTKINEGMDLKILKTKSLKLKNNNKLKKAILVKLPNGSTAYIAR